MEVISNVDAQRSGVRSIAWLDRWAWMREQSCDESINNGACASDAGIQQGIGAEDKEVNRGNTYDKRHKAPRARCEASAKEELGRPGAKEHSVEPRWYIP